MGISGHNYHDIQQLALALQNCPAEQRVQPEGPGLIFTDKDAVLFTRTRAERKVPSFNIQKLGVTAENAMDVFYGVTEVLFTT